VIFRKKSEKKNVSVNLSQKKICIETSLNLSNEKCYFDMKSVVTIARMWFCQNVCEY
jgi:hypothetical protein